MWKLSKVALVCVAFFVVSLHAERDVQAKHLQESTLTVGGDAGAEALAVDVEGEGAALGDSHAQAHAKDTLLSQVDTDADGDISRSEVQRYINDTGGKSLDERSEIIHASELSFDAMDDNRDNGLTKLEMDNYWTSIASLLSVDEVRDWAAFAMQLPPALVENFVSKGVTGYDFPELLANDGELLASELGVGLNSVRQRIMRGMRMKLMGMGEAPPAVAAAAAEAESCVHSTIRWSAAARSAAGMEIPVHKYVLQRQMELSPPPQQLHARLALQSQDVYIHPHVGGPVQWETVYAGTEVEYVDALPWLRSVDERGARRARFYRVAPWNVIGRADYTYIDEQPLPHGACLSPENDANDTGDIKAKNRTRAKAGGRGAQGKKHGSSEDQHQQQRKERQQQHQGGYSDYGWSDALGTLTTTLPLVLQLIAGTSALYTVCVGLGFKLFGGGKVSGHGALSLLSLPVLSGWRGGTHTLRRSTSAGGRGDGGGWPAGAHTHTHSQAHPPAAAAPRTPVKEYMRDPMSRGPSLRRSRSLEAGAKPAPASPGLIRRLASGLRASVHKPPAPTPTPLPMLMPVSKSAPAPALGLAPSVTIDTSVPFMQRSPGSCVSVATSPIHADTDGNPIVGVDATSRMTSPTKPGPCPGPSSLASALTTDTGTDTGGTAAGHDVAIFSKQPACACCSKKFKVRVLTASRLPTRCVGCSRDVCKACFNALSMCCQACC